MKLRDLLTFTLIILATGCSMTTSRLHPSLEDELKQIDSVVIAPPDVEILLVTLTGENERLTEREEELRAELISVASRELQERGYEVVEHDFGKSIAEDEDFAYLVSEIKDGFEQAKKDLNLGKMISEEEANKIQASVGEAVNVVAEASGADAILLIRYEGFQKSEGQIAKDVGTSVLVGVLTLGAVIPVQQTSGAMTEVALIDGTTGDVLWADIRRGTLNSGIADEAMYSMPDDVDEVDEVLKLPNKENSHQVDGKKEQE